MKTIETIEDFYRNKLGELPIDIAKGIGHINVFDYADFEKRTCTRVPYIRKDYYKISLLIGRRQITYIDKVEETPEYAIMFSNPDAPYQWQAIDEKQGGYCLVFTPEFLDEFPGWKKLPVFNVRKSPFFEISSLQAEEISGFYIRILNELKSKYIYKYDLSKAILIELIHFVLKNCNVELKVKDSNESITSSKRITLDFMELLESQFPVDNPGHLIKYTSASDFSELLNIHVNHLNKSVRSTTGKSTTHIITERIMHESKILLKTTNWNISEIGYALGFKEATHFNNFFKKNLHITPSEFRVD